MDADTAIQRLLDKMKAMEGYEAPPSFVYVDVTLRCRHTTRVPGWTIEPDMKIECYRCDADWEPMKWSIMEWSATEIPCGQDPDDYRSTEEYLDAWATDKLWNSSDPIPTGPMFSDLTRKEPEPDEVWSPSKESLEEHIARRTAEKEKAR